MLSGRFVMAAPSNAVAARLAKTLSGVIKGVLAEELATIIVLAIPKEFAHDPYFWYHLQSYMAKNLMKKFERPVTGATLTKAARGLIISLIADAFAEAVGATLRKWGYDSTRVILAEYWMRLLIEDAYAAATTGAASGGLSVVATTAKVSVSAILGQAIGLIEDTRARNASLRQLQDMIPYALEAAGRASARGDTAGALRLLNQAAEAEAYVKGFPLRFVL